MGDRAVRRNLSHPLSGDGAVTDGRREKNRIGGETDKTRITYKSALPFLVPVAAAAGLPNLLTLSFANSGKPLRVAYCEIEVPP